VDGKTNLMWNDQANTSKLLQERRIAYVLKTGANWSGPIKSFRLVVHKGFCFDNVKRDFPDRFRGGKATDSLCRL
jgi:Domain of unknown function (DUF4424)